MFTFLLLRYILIVLWMKCLAFIDFLLYYYMMFYMWLTYFWLLHVSVMLSLFCLCLFNAILCCLTHVYVWCDCIVICCVFILNKFDVLHIDVCLLLLCYACELYFVIVVRHFQFKDFFYYSNKMNQLNGFTNFPQYY